jgi:RluA family pseudouridine synthase
VGEISAEPKIIAETPDYVVVYKPSGLLTHPTQANEKETLSGWLVKKYPAMKKVGDSLSPPPPSLAEGENKRPTRASSRFAGVAGRAEGENMRPGIVHRLDKEASGLLVVARTQKMFNHLKEQFKNRTIEKEYTVLAHGKVAKDWAEINFPIGRSETSAKMAAMPRTVKGQPSAMGKEAATEFEVEQRFVNFTLLKVKIHTGRMHQIRAHLFAYNHPVVGDPLYFQKRRKNDWDKKCGRLFLHCSKLSFTDLGGRKQCFEAALPQELVQFLRQLT